MISHDIKWRNPVVIWCPWAFLARRKWSQLSSGWPWAFLAQRKWPQFSSGWPWAFLTWRGWPKLSYGAPEHFWHKGNDPSCHLGDPEHFWHKGNHPSCHLGDPEYQFVLKLHACSFGAVNFDFLRNKFLCYEIIVYHAEQNAKWTMRHKTFNKYFLVCYKMLLEPIKCLHSTLGQNFMYYDNFFIKWCVYTQ